MMPALFTKQLTGPNFFTPPSMHSYTCAKFVTSQLRHKDFGRFNAFILSTLLAKRSKGNPFCEKQLAVAAPIPELAPINIIHHNIKQLPVITINFFIFSIFFVCFWITELFIDLGYFLSEIFNFYFLLLFCLGLTLIFLIFKVCKN